MKRTPILMLIGALSLGSAGAALAGAATATVNNMAPTYHAQTIGQQLANGSITEQQVDQLVAFTGISPDKAKDYTVAQISAMRWKTTDARPAVPGARARAVPAVP